MRVSTASRATNAYRKPKIIQAAAIVFFIYPDVRVEKTDEKHNSCDQTMPHACPETRRPCSRQLIL